MCASILSSSSLSEVRTPVRLVPSGSRRAAFFSLIGEWEFS